MILASRKLDPAKKQLEDIIP